MPTNSIKIHDINGFAQGVGRQTQADGRPLVCLARHTLPGDQIVIKGAQQMGRYLQVTDYDLLSPSPLRQEPHCQYAGKCPGCSLHSTNTSDYLQLKSQVFRNLVRGPLSHIPIKLVSGPVTGFRNRIQLKRDPKSGQLAYQNDDGSLYAVDECPIADTSISELIPCLSRQDDLNFVNRFYLKTMPDQTRIIGAFVSREPTTKELSKLRSLNEYAKVFWVRDNSQGLVLDPEWLESGVELWETVQNRKISWSPEAFFQTNRQVLNQVAETLRQWISQWKPQRVWDLYCGVGTLLYSIADLIPQGLGVEVNSKAIQNALKTAKDWPNLSFIVKDLPRGFKELKSGGTPDLVLVNPPRQGLGRQMTEAIAALKCERIVYMSCNPISLEKDLQILTAHDYSIGEAEAYDMFAHTAHFETLVALKRIRNLSQASASA